MSTAGGPSVAILVAPGTNREGETARAVELAGGRPAMVEVPELVAGGATLGSHDVVIVPGGFSYGDALGAGSVLSLGLTDVLAGWAATGKPLMGICNGFQVLVKAGLLPGPPDATRRVTLTDNERGRFECRWVHLQVVPGGAVDLLDGVDELVACPIAHGEGRVAVAADGGATTSDAAGITDTVARLEADGCVALRYVDADGSAAGGAYPINPNGSVADIAGLRSPAGNVVGFMPHPEDHVHEVQDPFGRPGRLGLSVFRSVVAHG
ncbi:MAG: phosphoribosylformylglycinamidine synthase I [Actinomycetota bacterium]|nr:phosphoribosylformylglycinamidine synthase I [Actinomycetota bacterium]